MSKSLGQAVNYMLLSLGLLISLMVLVWHMNLSAPGPASPLPVRTASSTQQVSSTDVIIEASLFSAGQSIVTRAEASTFERHIASDPYVGLHSLRHP